MTEQILEHNNHLEAYINVILESQFAPFMVAGSPTYSGIGDRTTKPTSLIPTLLIIFLVASAGALPQTMPKSWYDREF
jgi:hypothetical protein